MYKRQAQAIEQKTSYIKNVLDAQDQYIEKYTLLLNSIPADVSLTHIELGEDRAKIEGTSSNVESVRALHRKLVQTEGFETATIGTITSAQEIGYEFFIEVLPKRQLKK